VPRDWVDDLIDRAVEADPVEWEIDEFPTSGGPPLTEEEICAIESKLELLCNV
jgi:hypothetical protein